MCKLSAYLKFKLITLKFDNHSINQLTLFKSMRLLNYQFGFLLILQTAGINNIFVFNVVEFYYYFPDDWKIGNWCRLSAINGLSMSILWINPFMLINVF